MGSNPILSARLEWKVSRDGHFPLFCFEGLPTVLLFSDIQETLIPSPESIASAEDSLELYSRWA